jgi:AcrR family transcriptional regulator
VGITGPKRDLEAKQRILQAARELIGTRGPNRVSINEIAAAAGVGKQTIYRWWGSKAAVVVDALEEAFIAENPVVDSGSTHDDIRTQLRRVAAMFASPMGCIVRELVADSQGDAEIAEEFRVRFLEQRRERARDVIERGIERGELRADLPVETVIDVLYAPLWLRLLTGHQPLTRRAADQILELVWPALTPARSRRPRSALDGPV